MRGKSPLNSRFRSTSHSEQKKIRRKAEEDEKRREEEEVEARRGASGERERETERA